MPILGIIASSKKGAPAIPTIGTATNVGTARAYNNGAATVAFTPGVGVAATSFTAISSPGGFTGSGASSPITVTGLQSGVSYTFTVTASNASGTSAASSASNSVTATTVPQAPTIGTATRVSSSATVTYTTGATGGSTITSFVATSSPGSLTGSGSSPITVSGLSGGTTYTFTVTAINVNGTSLPSAASNSIFVPYAVGGIGPGGGRIFYDAGSTLSWGRYLEAAISTTSPSWSDVSQVFSGNTSSSIGTTGTAIGTGRTNTQDAYAQSSTGSRAVSTTWTYTGGGFNSTVNASTGWFLASQDELNTLYGQKTMVGGFGASYYWSSSEFNASNSYAQDFGGGGQIYDSKSFDFFVRPIRAF